MRAPRRHPAEAALVDLRRWKARWSSSTTTADLEHIVATEAWLRRIMKTPATRAPAARQATPAAADPAPAPSARKARKDPRLPSGHAG